MPTKNAVYLLLSFLFVIGSMSCTKIDDMDDTDPNEIVASFDGDFVSSAHPTNGMAIVNEDKTKLHFIDFKTDSGPDLDIYLVSDINNINGDYIDLGNIKGVNGNYAYDLEDGTDFLNYKYVVVWCVSFGVNFGYAELSPQ